MKLEYDNDVVRVVTKQANIQVSDGDVDTHIQIVDGLWLKIVRGTFALKITVDSDEKPVELTILKDRNIIQKT